MFHIRICIKFSLLDPDPEQKWTNMLEFLKEVSHLTQYDYEKSAVEVLSSLVFEETVPGSRLKLLSILTVLNRIPIGI